MVVSLVSVLPTVTARALTYGDYEYEILDDKTVEITKYNSDAKLLTIPSVINGYTVTSIGNYAFNYCDSLKDVTVPDGIKNIGDNSFSYCWNLMSITLPDSVLCIGDYAFYNCEKLESITLPKNLISIGESAFIDCKFRDIIIPPNVTNIENYAFSSCLYLRKITFSNSLKTIGENAFSYCGCLTSITIPNNVSNIGAYAFYNCGNLKDITIPDSVIYIGAGAFNYCDDLIIRCNRGSYAEQYAVERELIYGFIGEENIIKPNIPSYNAFLMFADHNWLWSNMSAQAGGQGYGVDAEITKNGTYTVAITSESVEKNENGINPSGKGGTNAATGAVVLCVDITGILCCHNFNAKDELKNGITKEGPYSEDDIKCKLKSIKQDGQEIKFDASRVIYGNIEDWNTNYRIEIYNIYGKTKDNLSIDLNSVKWSQSLEVTFEISGLDNKSNVADSNERPDEHITNSVDKSNPSDETSNSSQNTNSNSNQNTTTTTTIKTKSPNTNIKSKSTLTTSPAPTAIKKAKIKNLNAKAKGKKITLSWKKIKNAKGYQLQAATNKKFKKKQIVFDKKTKNKKITIKGNKIKKNRIYYIRVRAYTTGKNTNGKPKYTYSKWTKKKVKNYSYNN